MRPTEADMQAGMPGQVRGHLPPPIYQRARAAGIPASQAASLARWYAKPLPGPVPEYGSPVTWPERDGFALRLSVDYDEGMTLDDLGYGTFAAEPVPGAIRNPWTDSRNPSNGRAYYVPGDMGTLADHAAEYRRMGASRSVAWDMAREAVRDELRRITTDYGPAIVSLTVTASRNGIDLGSASTSGIELGWDDITRDNGDRYLAEVAEDIIPEAIAEARNALAMLLDGPRTA